LQGDARGTVFAPDDKGCLHAELPIVTFTTFTIGVSDFRCNNYG
jgi:hypothetical protein